MFCACSTVFFHKIGSKPPFAADRTDVGSADKAGLDLNRRYGRFRTFVDGAPNGSLEPFKSN